MRRKYFARFKRARGMPIAIGTC